MGESRPLVINGQEVAPGRRQLIDLPLPDLYTHSTLHMPVQVVRGRRNGPRLFLSAAVHGDEINGVEIIRRLLAMPLIKRLRGALIVVPVVNVYGFIGKSRYLPDRRDLNRSFPGSERGSLAGRIAQLFLQEIVANADIGIDLHTGAVHRSNLPQIRADLSNAEAHRLAQAFGAPVILDSTNPPDGSLRQALAERELPLLLFEGGEALRFDELAIRAGVRGIIAVMRATEMLAPAKKHKKTAYKPTVARRSGWVRAPQSGIMRAAKPLGARVMKNDVLAVVSDPFGDQETPVLARYAGIIIGRTHLPLVNEGEALFHVAWVSRPGRLEEHVEAYHEELGDMDELGDPDEPDIG